MRILVTIAALALAGLASFGPREVAAQEPESPAPINPVGDWDFAITFDGQEIYGLLTFKGSAEDGYTGSLDTEMGGAAISEIKIEGQTVTFTVPDADATALLTFDGPEFAGTMSGAMGNIEIWGTKREGG